jgi:hypothetical protein
MARAEDVPAPVGSHECGSLLTKSGRPCRITVWNCFSWCHWHYKAERQAAGAATVASVESWLREQEKVVK